MYRKLNSMELKWLEMIMEPDFKFKDILKEQIEHSLIEYNQEPTCIFLKFKVESGLRKYPLKVRVPVELQAFQNNGIPIRFLLHVINGYIDELEIFYEDSSLISFNIAFSNINHIVNF